MARERFNYQDAGLVNFDRPSYPHNIGSVGIFEGDIPFERYVRHVEERLELVPRYRQRMVPVPLQMSRPIWADDPTFSIRDHVRTVALPAPGDRRQLAQLAGEFFAEPLDRDHSLWQILLVHGLRGGRTAQLVKAHHCLVDGVGGVQLLLALLDTTAEPRTVPIGAPYEPEPLPSSTERLIDGVFDRIEEQIDIAEGLALALVHPSRAVNWARSIGRALLAARQHLSRPAPQTPWTGKLVAPRRLAWRDVPLAEARTISHTLGGKVNDVVLTILAGALRKYYQLHDWETRGVTLRVAAPVNVRSDAEAKVLGNHVSIMLIGLPIDVEDPKTRFYLISREVKSLKEVDQAGGIASLLSSLGHLSPPVQAALGGHLSAPNVITNLICSNVRGPETPLYCLGHPMLSHYPWILTTWRMGLSVAVMSYMKNLSFSFTGDAHLLQDIDRIGEFLEEDFWDLYSFVATGTAIAASPSAGADLSQPVPPFESGARLGSSPRNSGSRSLADVHGDGQSGTSGASRTELFDAGSSSGGGGEDGS